MGRKVYWDLSRVDLDWRAMKPMKDRANSGTEILSDMLSDGWILLQVWHDARPNGGTMALLKRRSKAPKRASSV